jgi:glycosyltransferase involved in cell wall biosynthesis
MRNRQLKRADQIWVMSEEMKRYFSRMLDRKKIKVWPSAVSTKIDPSAYKSKRIKLRKKIGIDSKDKIIVYIGTLSRLRGLEFVLDSMKIILDKMTNVKLLFIGYSLNGNDLDFLKEYANQINVQDNVIFHPRVNEDELPYYIEMCHVGISPFKPNFVLKHNSPLKLLEYFKAGVPVVATDIPEQRVIIGESQAGLLVKWNQKEFGDAVIKILSLSKEENKAWGYKGYEWIKKNRDIEKMTKTMLDWFREL